MPIANSEPLKYGHPYYEPINLKTLLGVDTLMVISHLRLLKLF